MAINKAAFFIGFPFVNLLLASNLHNTEANAFVAVIFPLGDESLSLFLQVARIGNLGH
jgi:hypothetical protein